MDIEQKTIVFGLASIVVGIAALVNADYRIYILILYPIFLVVYLISSYVKMLAKTPHFSVELAS